MAPLGFALKGGCQWWPRLSSSSLPGTHSSLGHLLKSRQTQPCTHSFAVHSTHHIKDFWSCTWGSEDHSFRERVRNVRWHQAAGGPSFEIILTPRPLHSGMQTDWRGSLWSLKVIFPLDSRSCLLTSISYFWLLRWLYKLFLTSVSLTRRQTSKYPQIRHHCETPRTGGESEEIL